MPNDVLVVHPMDNVAVALTDLKAGTTVTFGDGVAAEVVVRQDVPFAHKIAIRPITTGARVVKHGYPIGIAVVPIAPGEHVHVHNVVSLQAAPPLDRSVTNSSELGESSEGVGRP